ncbi:HD domain-containing phosphohydrolase [Thermotoga sp. KOL6]|uniref:HD domain-containing phosphohydrolase n=1 Tax=Thermotoga sp. KOL6 TaxID=126741 RepID=UPI001E341754|nr:HD domain-containing phosphohydrolase [Thermotoga sp. KOL6]
MDKDYAPFSFYNEKGELVGISVDFWKLFSKKTGIKIELVPVEWQTAQQMVVDGRVDAVDQIFKTPEREKIFSFSKPIFEMKSCVFFKKDLPIKNFDDLSSYIVGVLKGEGMVGILKEKNPNVRFEFFKDYSSIMKALKEGRISVFLGDDLVARYYLAKENISSGFTSLHLGTNYLYVATLKEKKSVLDLINSGLSKISEKEKQEILGNYVPVALVIPSWVTKFVLYSGAFFTIALGVVLSFVYLLRRKVAERTEQLELANEELRAQNQEIEALYEEISASQEEIEKLYLELKELSERFRNSIRELSKLVFVKDPNIFAQKLFLMMEELLEVKGVKIELENVVVGEADGETFDIAYGNEKYGRVKIEGELSIEERKTVKSLFTIISAIYAFKKLVKKERELHRDIVRTWVKALEYYDYYTRGHSEEVARYAVEIGKMFGLSGEKLEKLYWAGLLHDIGKIYVPQAILNKTGKLDAREFDVIKIHPVKGYELVKEIEGFEDVALWIRHHHERWDGKGYPDGLKGEEIEFEARILCVADSYQAMRSDRPYKRGRTVKESIQELLDKAGKQFDPEIVRRFVEFLERGGDLGTRHQG